MSTAGARWRGSMFGLTIDSAVGLPGSRSPDGPRARELTLDLTDAETIRADADAQEQHLIAEQTGRSGDRVMTIRQSRSGYLFDAPGLGLFLLDSGGETLLCTEPPGTAWLRFVTGQVLPFACALQGLEPLHASAVEVGGRAVALLGRSGAGKSTMAANLVADGAGFITDDVLALEVPAEGGSPVAYTGPRIAKFRHEGLALLAVPPSTTPGPDGLVLERYDAIAGPVPLGATVFLRPDPDIGEPSLRELDPPDPDLILQATFNFVLDSPDRLLTHLETCAAIEETAEVYVAAVPERPTPADARSLRAQLLDGWRSGKKSLPRN